MEEKLIYFGKNIKLLRKRRRLTQNDVADFLGIKRSTLSGYENNIALPPLNALILFADYFKVSIDTLIRIDMTSLADSQLSELERGFDVYVKGSSLRVLATTVNNSDDDNVELVPEKAKAGYSTGYADLGFIKELPVFNLPFLDRSKKYRTFEISGDSMSPITDGSWVTGEYVVDWNTIKTNDCCIIITRDDGIVFKIVENLLVDENKLKLHSLNSFYKPYDVYVDEIIEVWRFVHYISVDIPEPLMPKNDLIATIAKLKADMNIVKQQIIGD